MKTKVMSLFSAFIMMFFAATSVLATEYDASNPYTLIKNVADDTFTHLKENQQTYQKSPELLKQVAQKNILPHINVRFAAYKVLGAFANKATKEERDAFTDAFSDYLLTLYAQILIQYTDQKVDVEPAKPIDANRNIVSVQVDIMDNQRPPINLDFKLRKNEKTNEWQGYDVEVEGVSMLDTKASEWQRDLRKNGIAYVTKELVELSKSPIKKESKS